LVRQSGLSPDKNKVAFTSYRNSKVNIFTMNIDGTGEKQLTNISEPDQSGHVWSPDGMRLVFRGSDGIYVINSDGTGERHLTSNYEDRFASWSPDGNKIIFSSFRDDSLGILSSIYIINADGNNLIRLTNDTINARFPLWLPDGNTIAFMRTTETGFSDIYLMNQDGSGLKQITPSELDVTYMSISPDGRRIAFCHWVWLYKLDLYMINIDGSGLQKLNPEGFNMDGLGYFHWSSDGNILAFSPGYSISEQLTTENYGIYTIHSDGSNLRYLGAGSNPQLSLKLSQYSNY